MLYMVSYDISDDHRRHRIHKILEGYGERVQYSVFELNLSDSQYIAMMKEALAGIDAKTDSIRFYPLCWECQSVAEHMGNANTFDDDGFFIV